MWTLEPNGGHKIPSVSLLAVDGGDVVGDAGAVLLVLAGAGLNVPLVAVPPHAASNKLALSSKHARRGRRDRGSKGMRLRAATVL